ALAGQSDAGEASLVEKTRRQGDKETRKTEVHPVLPFSSVLVSLSPCLLVSLSLCRRGRIPMRRPLALLLVSGLLTAAAGCRNCDLLEAELRTRENDLRELRADLSRAESHNEALMRELGALRQSSSSAKLSPEAAA